MDIRRLRAALQIAIVGVANENVDKEFIFGQRDCHTLTLEIFDAVTNSNALHVIKGKYKTPKGAMRLKTKLGLEIKDFVEHYCETIDHRTLTSGDLILRWNEEYTIHDVCWYLGNNRFLIANNFKGIIEIEQLDIQQFNENDICYRLTEDALLLKIEPFNITKEE